MGTQKIPRKLMLSSGTTRAFVIPELADLNLFSKMQRRCWPAYYEVLLCAGVPD